MPVDVSQIQQILDSAHKADAFKTDVKRALKKVSALLANLQTAVSEAETLMSAEYTPAVKERKARTPQAAKEAAEADPEAPYGRKKNGEPKSKPGRTK